MANLRPDEIAFFERARPHIAAGMSIEDAAKAVLEDDLRLYIALTDRRSPLPHAIAHGVYHRLRAEAAHD